MISPLFTTHKFKLEYKYFYILTTSQNIIAQLYESTLKFGPLYCYLFNPNDAQGLTPSQICTQELLPAMFKEPLGMPEIEPGLAVLRLWPLYCIEINFAFSHNSEYH